jgi:hypothetical protein
MSHKNDEKLPLKTKFCQTSRNLANPEIIPKSRNEQIKNVKDKCNFVEVKKILHNDI